MQLNNARNTRSTTLLDVAMRTLQAIFYGAAFIVMALIIAGASVVIAENLIGLVQQILILFG